MTAPTAHHLRLTIRIHADSFHKEADVALPLSSSLGELMAELTDLVDAPAIDSPWRASTASGRTIDLTARLPPRRLRKAPSWCSPRARSGPRP
ncbi:hypothetical protein [Corynebacterium sp. KPL3739]|uniref:hypothetical protein n=1 Tax=Corynebacterium sp. KPL3739 TaxID=3158321 RepID=UPI0032ED07CF